MTSDEALMLEFQGGSRAAFEEFFARYRQPLYGSLVRQLNNPGRAEDLDGSQRRDRVGTKRCPGIYIQRRKDPGPRLARL